MRRLVILVLVVAAVPLSVAAAVQASPVFPIGAGACPGFAESYPADYLFSGNLSFGFVNPGSYVAPGTDQNRITLFQFPLGHPNGLWLIVVHGLTAPGEAPDGSAFIPPLTAFAAYSYRIDGVFITQPGTPAGPPSGNGLMQIVRSDGARMLGQASIVQLPNLEWSIGFSGAPHCVGRLR